MSGGRGIERAWDALLATVAPARRHPPVTVEFGPSVPAWVLRLAIPLAGVGCGVALGLGSDGWLFALPVVVATAVWPGGPAPAVFASGAGILLLATRPEVFDAQLVALVAGVHLVVELATVVDTLPWSARVDRRIVVRAATRFAALQVVAQVVVAVGAWATGTRMSVPLLTPVAGLALAVTAWLLLRRVGTLASSR